jgi:ubiquinone/menaquinone biosynthesis C-methylase UbiE
MGFSAERFAALSEMEPEHFWFAGRRALLDAMLKPLGTDDSPLLDVGCGTGSLVDTLSARGRRVVGLDQRPEGIAAARARLGQAGQRGSGFVRGDAERLPFASGVFGGAMALDVLEHVDDERMLREIKRVVQPNGWVLVTVPAYQALWSQRDELAGHRRRYTRRGLLRLLQGAGLRVESVRGYQFSLLPLVAISRVLGRRTTHTREIEDKPSKLVNRLLRLVNLAEVRSGIPWPVGSSFAALGRVPA